MKPIAWVGSAKRDLVTCSPDVCRVAGRELERVHVDGEPRVFYVATFPEAVYVLHVFEKKSRKTSPRDLVLGKQRYQAMLQERRTP